MEHIRQYDWCSSAPDLYFVSERDMDNSATEKILRNKFHDPLVSSDSEDGRPKEKINWDEIFKKKKNDKVHHTVVPGSHPVPPYPKLSALNGQQHFILLKVLCAQNLDILPGQFIGRPTKKDFRTFEELKETYIKEQKEFIEWAKTMWTSNHCVRALRPKPQIETIYDAEFKVTAHRMESFPKHFALAAQIPLESNNTVCDMVHEKVLIKVNNSSLPQVEIPNLTSSRVFIMKPYPTPEPCSKHPCRFTLPNESDMSILPLTEVLRELAQYAADNSAAYISSEAALRSLLELHRRWLLPVAVCRVIAPDGEPTNVVVLDDEFSLNREPAPTRTRRAFNALLYHELVPYERPKTRSAKRPASANEQANNKPTTSAYDMDLSDNDDDHLYIDTGDLQNTTEEHNDMDTDCLEDNNKEEGNTKTENGHTNKDNENTHKEKVSETRNNSLDNRIDFFNCTCRDILDQPPLRSYKKWRVINKGTNDKYSIIVHTPHRARISSGEALLAALPEYQLDVGASEREPHDLCSQALALMLRKNASILNVRIDSTSGEIVTTETVHQEDFIKQHADIVANIHNRLYTTLDQLQGLMPGHYVLQHEPEHGNNAILYRTVPAADSTLTLRLECAQAADADEAKTVRPAPVIAPVLLPIHKFRHILPCAFSPFPQHVARASRRPPARLRPPPQGIKWPKRKGKKKNQNNNS